MDKKLCVFDIEGDSLNPTKIHCLVAAIFDGERWVQKSTTDYDQMRKFFLQDNLVVVGHNVVRWDIPNVERLLNIKFEGEIIDTLGLSWYLYPDKLVHGLEDWGVYFGIPKPKITDWENQTIKEYLHRCQEDVKINCKLWDKQWKELLRLYDGVEEDANRLIKYLMFKLDCAREAEKSRWRLDVDKAKEALKTLKKLKQEKVDELSEVMPIVEKIGIMERPESLYLKGKTYTKPKTYLKVDGTLSEAGKRFKALCESVGEDPEVVDEVYVPNNELSAQGLKWMDLIEAMGLPEDWSEPIETIIKTEKGNPNSHQQMKDFLFSLGWKPENFNDSKKKDENGKEYIDKIPQIRIEENGEKVLCPSVRRLFKVEPKLQVMEGLTILTHRIGILKGFIKNVDDEGYLKAEISGFTNTLRFKHSVIVNLPSVKKPYGDIVRGVLIAPEGYELCGSDMSSLEDRTKQHYMWDYDPEYVKEMQTPDFDPHLNLAEFSGALTPEQVQAHKDKKEDHGVVRHQYKTTNYSATYKVGAKKLSSTIDDTQEAAQILLDAFWEKNWSILEIEKDQKIKVFYREGNILTYKVYNGYELIVDKENDSWSEKQAKYAIVNNAESMWLFNPVSKFWYSLRYPKDIFSTLNQGTGVFCFDTWIANFMGERRQLTLSLIHI